MNVVAIIQARMGSTRLPGKVLLPLCGKPMLWHIIERVKRATLVDDVVCAVPQREWIAMMNAVPDHAASFFGYDGDEADLVGRYLAAAEWAEADVIVRVCADNPCVEGTHLDDLIRTYMGRAFVFLSNAARVMVEGRAIDGLGAEVFSISRLKWLDQITQNLPTKYREHIHRWFEEFGEFTALYEPSLPGPTLRLDVNTQADYEFIADIYNHVYPLHPQFTIADVLAYLATKEATHGISHT